MLDGLLPLGVGVKVLKLIGGDVELVDGLVGGLLEDSRGEAGSELLFGGMVNVLGLSVTREARLVPSMVLKTIGVMTVVLELGLGGPPVVTLLRGGAAGRPLIGLMSGAKDL